MTEKYRPPKAGCGDQKISIPFLMTLVLGTRAFLVDLIFFGIVIV